MNELKVITVEWGTDKVVLFPFPNDGSFIGHIKGTKKFLYIPMYADGTPALDDLGTIDNVDDNVEFVEMLNEFFGTNVTINDFPGR